LQPVLIDKEKHLIKTLEFYMGKNTPDRQDFIMTTCGLNWTRRNHWKKKN